MSYIAAMMLLNLDVFEAFVIMANILNRPFLLSFYRMDTDRVPAPAIHH